MTKIELALEILHTRSKTAQDSQNKSTQYLEEETIEVQIKSKSIQLKIKKISSTGLTDAPSIGASDAWLKFRRPVGLSLLEAS